MELSLAPLSDEVPDSEEHTHETHAKRKKKEPDFRLALNFMEKQTRMSTKAVDTLLLQ